MDVRFSDGSTEQYEDRALGRGGQGEVFRSLSGEHVVKLYYPNPQRDTERTQRIEALIKDYNPTKDPYWQEYFTWPLKRVTEPRVGFSMRFVDGLKTLDHYILSIPYQQLKPEERGWFIGRVVTAMKLVSAANELAKAGLCYPDFSHKNILVEPFEGRMVLIDCDCLIVPGRLEALVKGTLWYLAPELVTGAATKPSVETDRHALAVLLYLWLLEYHPLMGDKHFDADPDKDDQLRLGKNALYVEHPTDVSNRARDQLLKAPALGPEMEKLFQVAFVDGLHNFSNRPYAYQWQQALYHTYDRIIPCTSPQCPWHSFVAMPTAKLACPACKTPLGFPRTLPFVYLYKYGRDDYYTNDPNAHYVVGWPGRRLHHWHARYDVAPFYSGPNHLLNTEPLAVFEYDPAQNHWYLKNLAMDEMLYGAPGIWDECPKNGSLPLMPGMWIQFGSSTRYFRARIDIINIG